MWIIWLTSSYIFIKERHDESLTQITEQDIDFCFVVLCIGLYSQLATKGYTLNDNIEKLQINMIGFVCLPWPWYEPGGMFLCTTGQFHTVL